MPNLDLDYERAGFGRQLGFGHSPALLVIDFVRAYLDPASPLYAGAEAAVEPAQRVLVASRNARIPVVFTKVVYEDGGRDGGAFFKKVKALELFVGQTTMGQIIPELAPRVDELVIEKQYASAFFGTPLASVLTMARVDSVIVTGMSTSGCVRATVVDAISLGHMPIVVSDAVGDHTGPHEANLFDMAAKYADVMTADEIVANLEA